MASGTTVQMPRLIRVWPDLGEVLGCQSRPAAYAAYESLPDSLKVRLGRRVRVDSNKLADWLNAGGHKASHAACRA